MAFKEWSQSTDAASFALTGLPTPSANSDAATKGYVTSLFPTTSVTGIVESSSSGVLTIGSIPATGGYLKRTSGATSIAAAATIAYSEVTGGPSTGTISTLGGDTQDWSFATGLTGDTDGDYIIDASITFDASGRTALLYFNGSAPTTIRGAYGYMATSAWAVVGDASSAALIAISNAALTCDIRIHIASKSGRRRHITGYFLTYATGSTCYAGSFNYVLYDTSTALTSLTFHGSASNSIKATSIARTQKLAFLA